MGCSEAGGLAIVTEPDSATAEPKFSSGPTILLVEDEDFVREVTGEVLQSAGFRVLKAREAIEATVAFRRHRHEVQLLITDVVLPGQNGRDLARELRSVSADLKTLFVSGYPDNAITQEAGEECAVFYLPKPFSAQTLVQAVSQILGCSRDAETRTARRAAGSA
jgi:DNA-binding NtrC family response regulator